MALNENIILSGQTTGQLSALAEGGVQGLQVRSMLDQMNQEREFKPIRKSLLESQAQQQVELGDQAAIDAERKREAISMATGAMEVLPFLTGDNIDIQGAVEAVDRRSQRLVSEGRTDLSDTVAVAEALESGDPQRIHQVTKQMQSIVDIAEKQGLFGVGKSASQRDFESKIANLSEEEKEEARRINLGLDPRAVGSAAQTIAEEGTTEEVAESEAVIAARKAAEVETAKLSSQLELKPEVEAAVVASVAEAKRAGDLIGEQRNNKAALRIYETAITGLTEALGGTITGPGAGWIPALTSNAQIANGAIASMAPILKQIFRAVGEGVFTDKDQELLLGMIPSRHTTPKARVSQLSNIDAIVRAKLNVPAVEGSNNEADPAKPPIMSQAAIDLLTE